MTQIKFWPGAAANFFYVLQKKSFFLPSKEESYNVYTLIGIVEIDLFLYYLLFVENSMSLTLTTESEIWPELLHTIESKTNNPLVKKNIKMRSI